MSTERRIVAHKNEHLEDWWVVQLEDGTRLGGTVPEGSGAEMREMAKAILGRESFHAKRLATVTVGPRQGGNVRIWSPRNGSAKAPALTPREAEELAHQILRDVPAGDGE